jgi:DNA polymerase phi
MSSSTQSLQESSFEGEDASAQAGAVSWKPQLHFVWDTMLERVAKKSEDTSSLPDFFRIVVDGTCPFCNCSEPWINHYPESLFSNTSSQQRKFWGFRIFQKALPLASEDAIPLMFTQNFMRTWINHLSKKDRYLHKIAIETVSRLIFRCTKCLFRIQAAEIQAFVQKNPRLGLSFVLQLTGVHGSQQFDKLTNTKTLESLLASMDASGITDYVAYLLDQFNKAQG